MITTLPTGLKAHIQKAMALLVQKATETLQEINAATEADKVDYDALNLLWERLGGWGELIYELRTLVSAATWLASAISQVETTKAAGAKRVAKVGGALMRLAIAKAGAHLQARTDAILAKMEEGGHELTPLTAAPPAV